MRRSSRITRRLYAAHMNTLIASTEVILDSGCIFSSTPPLIRRRQAMSSMRLFEVFSEEKRKQRLDKLKADMEKNYFDDFKELRDTQGKMFQSSTQLTPPSHAPPFPPISATAPDGSISPVIPLTAVGGQVEATNQITLICIGLRAGCQPMLEKWAAPFTHQPPLPSPFPSSLSVVELSIVDSKLMSIWPLKSLLLRESRTAKRPGYAVHPRMLTYFGDSDELRRRLGLANKLTGYIFLVDGKGRIRWQASGFPTKEEICSLILFTQQIAAEQT